MPSTKTTTTATFLRFFYRNSFGNSGISLKYFNLIKSLILSIPLFWINAAQWFLCVIFCSVCSKCLLLFNEQKSGIFFTEQREKNCSREFEFLIRRIWRNIRAKCKFLLYFYSIGTNSCIEPLKIYVQTFTRWRSVQM